MKRITISEAQRSTSPNPITLVCVETPLGATNLTAISWWTYLANRPPMIGFAISKKSYTGELIAKNGCAVLCIPGAAIADAVFRCGCVSGRNIQKAEEFKIELTGGDRKYPVHSKLAFLCSLEKATEAGDHVFFICKVEDILYNENERQIYSWDGYSRLATLKEVENPE